MATRKFGASRKPVGRTRNELSNVAASACELRHFDGERGAGNQRRVLLGTRTLAGLVHSSITHRRRKPSKIRKPPAHLWSRPRRRSSVRLPWPRQASAYAACGWQLGRQTNRVRASTPWQSAPGLAHPLRRSAAGMRPRIPEVQQIDGLRLCNAVPGRPRRQRASADQKSSPHQQRPTTLPVPSPLDRTRNANATR